MHTFLDKVPIALRVGLIALRRRGAGRDAADDRPRARLGQAVDAADFFRGFGGTAIGDALALAVQVGLRSVGVTGDRSALQPARSLAATR